MPSLRSPRKGFDTYYYRGIASVYMKPSITIDTYHEYMCEAFSALRSGLSFLNEAQQYEEDDHHRHSMYIESGMQCRYSFLLAANALEAAANALLLGLGTSSALYSDLEKLPTLLKFEIFSISLGKQLDRGNDLYAKIKEVVSCRNEFVHPKPRKAGGRLSPDKKDVEIVVKKTKSRDYPIYFSIFEPKHSLQAVADILSFLAWVVFDLCGFSIQEGTMRLGYGSYSSSGDMLILAEEYGLDIRTFGDGKCIRHKHHR